MKKPEYTNLDILNISKQSAIETLGLEPGDKFVENSGWRDDELGYTNSLLVDII